MRPLQLFSFFAVVWLAVAVARAAGGYADGGHVGCTLEQRKGADFLWVDHVAEGGPAADAGIQKGDCIIGLNGISTEKMSAWDGRSRLSGAIGTTLLVRVRRDGSPDTDFTVVRKSLFDACSKAAEAGDPEAQCSIGYWYAYNSTARDPAKAAGFFRKAADQGYGPAQAQLGYMMKYGVGIPKDMKGGVAWYLKASRQGSAYAERDLGLSYLTGEGVPKSDKDAFAWFYSAALQDDSTAERNLGYLYRTGRGVARDDKAAFAWYYRSARVPTQT